MRARERIAAERAAQKRAEARRRFLVPIAAVTAVLAIIGVLVAVKLSSGPASAATASESLASSAVVRQVSSIPAAVLASVDPGQTVTSLEPVKTSGPPLTIGGKPAIVFVSEESCPFCAAERWALAAALSRFGTLSGLHFIHSSPTDGDIPTLSFYKSGYSSKYLAFAPVEWYGEADDPSTPFGHVYLQQPTAQEEALFDRYAKESLPFVDIGNRYVVSGVQYLPSALANMTWAQVAAAMRDPSSPVARDIDGAANMITAAICKLTHGQPAAVGNSPGVRAAAGSI